MPSVLQQVEILPWGGLNNGVEPLMLQDNESPDCLNVRFRKRGVRKRDGTARYINAQVNGANAVTGPAQLVKSDGTTSQLAFAGNDVFRENAGAWTSIKGGVTLTSSADNLFQFATLGDLLICTNNVDQILKWAGGSNNVAALGGTPPSAARAVATFFNYVVFLNTVESAVRLPGRFRWSLLNNAESYPAGNFNDVVNLGGQEGLALKVIGDHLFAFFDRSIHRVVYTGNDVTPFDFAVVSPVVGAISGFAVVPVKGGAFFLSEEGPYYFDGSTVDYIGKRVEDTWKNLNSARVRFCAGTHNRRRNEVLFSFATGSSIQNDTTLVYDYVEDKWTVDQGYASNVYGFFSKTLPLDPVFGAYTGYVMQANQLARDDDGAAIVAYANTKPLTFGRPGRRSKVRKLELVADSEAVLQAHVNVKYAYDLNAPSNLTQVGDAQTGPTFEDDKGTSLFDQVNFAIEGQQRVYTRTTGSGFYFQAQIGNDVLDSPMNVASLLAHVKGDDIGGLL